jgi:prophage tail gpP-like protein
MRAIEWIPATDDEIEGSSPFAAQNTAAGRFGAELVPPQVYDIFSDVEQIASAFQLNVPLSGNGMAMNSGDVAHFLVGDETVFIGRCDYTTSRTRPGSRRLAIVGRDLAYFLVDNYMPMAVSFDQVGILNIALRAANGSPLNKVVGRGASDLKMVLKSEPGEMRVAFLKRYLELSDNIAFVNELGELVVGRPSDAAAVGRLVVKEGENKGIVDVRVRRGPAMAFSEVRLLLNNPFGFGASDEPLWVESASPQPPRLSRRSFALLAPEAAKLADAKSLARNVVARSNKHRLEVEIVIDDHEYQGVVPKADQNWEIEIDGDDPVNETLYLKAIRYSRDQKDHVATTMSFAPADTVVSALKLAPTPVFGQ